ncbi:MAG: putative adenine-specific methylase [Prokaryotic dsDNA virus sp.]|nr:MAG: putative adenine-specific methylase [Prokaryotic dsDNA virus sp.]QDP59766.1 MAG: putative adenine-specific methylase [Prokaryotic dsDNA virus sp.]
MTDKQFKAFFDAQKGQDHIKSVDWWTPPYIFEALDLEFDIDVASPVGGVSWIPAKRYFTKWQDGLQQEWKGRVWCNPPYGRNTAQWLQKFVDHDNGVALVFARTDTKWFHDIVVKADALVFMKGRVSFLNRGEKNSTAGAGSMLIACGYESVEAIRKSNLGFFVDLLWSR